jgi:hypothetical protein
MRPLVAHCYRGLGKLYQRTGRFRKAETNLETATTMYRDMGMGFWLEEKVAISGKERIPGLGADHRC